MGCRHLHPLKTNFQTPQVDHLQLPGRIPILGHRQDGRYPQPPPRLLSRRPTHLRVNLDRLRHPRLHPQLEPMLLHPLPLAVNPRPHQHVVQNQADQQGGDNTYTRLGAPHRHHPEGVSHHHHPPADPRGQACHMIQVRSRSCQRGIK